MTQYLIGRNLWVYALLLALLFVSVDWNKCFHQRGRYLLGIFYNGFFQNTLDQGVYEDYLKRHHSSPQEFSKTL